MSSMVASGGLASLYAAMLPPPPPPVEISIDLEAIADDAYRAGFAAGRIEAEAELAPERAALRSATAALIDATTVDVDALRSVFIGLVRALAETVISAELKVNSEIMTRLVDTALASVVSRSNLVVRAHPDDAALLSIDLPIVGDPAQVRGTVSIDGPEFVVRDGLDMRLAALIEALI